MAHDQHDSDGIRYLVICSISPAVQPTPQLAYDHFRMRRRNPMRIHPVFRHVTRNVTCAFIGLATLSLIMTGCASGSKIAQNSKGSVYLEEVPDWSFEASHPAVIDQVTMAKVLRGIYTDSIQDGSPQMPAGGSKPMRIFSDEDVDFLTPLLA